MDLCYSPESLWPTAHCKVSPRAPSDVKGSWTAFVLPIFTPPYGFSSFVLLFSFMFSCSLPFSSSSPSASYTVYMWIYVAGCYCFYISHVMQCQYEFAMCLCPQASAHVTAPLMKLVFCPRSAHFSFSTHGNNIKRRAKHTWHGLHWEEKLLEIVAD